GRVDDPFHVAVARHVGGGEGDVTGDRLLGFVARAHHDCRTLGDEPLHDRGPDARGAAGHDGDPVGEAPAHRRHQMRSITCANSGANMMRSSGSSGNAIWPYAAPRSELRRRMIAKRQAANASYHVRSSRDWPPSCSYVAVVSLVPNI